MILCAGEALIDMLPRDIAEGGSEFAPHVGGAVFVPAVTAQVVDTVGAGVNPAWSHAL